MVCCHLNKDVNDLYLFSQLTKFSVASKSMYTYQCYDCKTTFESTKTFTLISNGLEIGCTKICNKCDNYRREMAMLDLDLM